MGTQPGAVWADAALTTPPLIRNTGERKLETARSQQHTNHSPGIQELSYRQKKIHKRKALLAQALRDLNAAIQLPD